MYLALALRMDERYVWCRVTMNDVVLGDEPSTIETDRIDYFLMVQAATIIEISIVCFVPKQLITASCWRWVYTFSLWNPGILPMVKRLAFPWRWSQRRCIRIICRPVNGWSVHGDGDWQFRKSPLFSASAQSMYSKYIFRGYPRNRFPYSERS